MSKSKADSKSFPHALADKGAVAPDHPVPAEVSATERDGDPSIAEDEFNWIPCHQYDEDAPPQPEPKKKVPQNFKILGNSGESYYYIPKKKGSIVDLTPSQHTLNNLLMLAPIDWWQKYFPKAGQKPNIDFATVVNVLLDKSHDVGIFKPQTAQRGGGIWRDKGRLVLHIGDKLLVDGKEQDMFSFESAYVYQKSQPIIKLSDQALSDQEAAEFIDIMMNLSWSDTIHGIFMAGWVVTSAMSGALEWRPHIYISAQEGAGKSWLNTNILLPALGDYALKLGSGTTEAGLRRMIEQDARPIMLDEMEGEDKKQLETRQSIILMTRKSSSGEKIVHASTTGDGIRQYNLYSSFMISSINIGVKEAADMDRFLRVHLIKKDNPEKFRALEKRVSALMTEDFAPRFLKRLADNGAVFLKNLATFRDVITDLTGDRRSGQQIGSLVAGAFLFMHRDEVEYEVAKKWCIDNRISEYSESKKTPSHELLLEYLMSCVISVNTGSKRIDMQISSVVEGAVENADYESALALHDIRVIKGNLCLKKSSQHIDRLLKETPWRDSWATTILRVAGVTESKNPDRFGPKATARQIKIPLNKPQGEIDV